MLSDYGEMLMDDKENAELLYSYFARIVFQNEKSGQPHKSRRKMQLRIEKELENISCIM